jgi:fructokinase
VGNDDKSVKIKQAMQIWDMTLAQLQIDSEHPTGVVQVSLNQGEASYDIVPNQAYDFIDAKQLDLATQYSVLYHGTLALRHPISAHALQTLKARHQGRVFIDVNLRAPWWQLAQLEQLLSTAHWVKVNQEELQQLQAANLPLKQAMQAFLTRYDLQVLVVTCGAQGAVALSQSGEFIEVQPETQLSVVDTVGAGDAFAAVLLLGLQRGWSLSLTMDKAQHFASRLVTQRGAIVQDMGFYQSFIDD